MLTFTIFCVVIRSLTLSQNLSGGEGYYIKRNLWNPKRDVVWRAGVLVGLLGLWWAAVAQGQPLPQVGLWQDTLAVGTTRVFVLRPFMLMPTVRVWLDGAALDSTAYHLDAVQGVLVLADSVQGQQLVVSYRTLPFRLNPVYQRYEALPFVPAAVVHSEQKAPAAAKVPVSPPETSLNVEGRITRGVVTGNRQDVTIASALQLALRGEVTDGLTLEALLSDADVPLSPEGTTQRLRAFDQIYVRLQNQHGQLQLGDYQLQLGETTLMAVRRKLQGAMLEVHLPGQGLLQGMTLRTSGAVARGTYRRQVIVPIEGVQGPYRLTGAVGEPFILVVPGSETVYLDGQPLVRGTDYLIDYATGTLTFTARRLITAERRISVEFEYTTGNSARTFLTTQAHLALGAGRQVGFLEATFLQEGDGRAFGKTFGLTAADTLALRLAGDGLATRPGAEPVPFDPEAPYVLYTREVRQLADGSMDTVYVALQAAPPPGETVYRVTFSWVGAGKGRYVRVGQTLNGMVYSYRGPGLGDYEPVRLLPTPMRQQMIGLRAGLKPLPRLAFEGEWARSRYDANRLSLRDAARSVADAYRFRVQLDTLHVPLGNVTMAWQRQYLGARFATFSRVQPVEFARRWNVALRDEAESSGVFLQPTTQIVDEGQLVLHINDKNQLAFELGRLSQQGTFRGTRQAMGLQLGLADLAQLRYQIEHIQSRDWVRAEIGRWFRQEGHLAVPLGEGWTPYMEVLHEDRRQRLQGSDTLRVGSIAYVALQPGLSWQRPQLEANVGLGWRWEQDVWEGTRQAAGQAWTLEGRLQYTPGPQFRTAVELGYRHRQTPPRFAARYPLTETIALHWDGFFQSPRQFARLTWRYAVRSERTPVLQEVYVRTGPEFGQYIWIDFNGDGLPQVDEFVPETLPDEGVYERVLIPSDTFMAATALETRVRLELMPGRQWATLRPLTLVTTLELHDRSQDVAAKRFSLLDPSRTLEGRLRLAQEVYLWRLHPDYGAELSIAGLRTLARRAIGLEKQHRLDGRIGVRYRVLAPWQLSFTAEVQRDRQMSEGLSSRTYRLMQRRLRLEATYTLEAQRQLSGAVALSQGTEHEAMLVVWMLRMPLTAELSQARQGRLLLRLEPAHVWANGPPSGLARYLLTDGLAGGWNLIAGVDGQRALPGNLQLTLSYHARASAAAGFRHTLRLELSAIF
ncbi:hypothetical protein HRbin18_00360 [bacterium HR18]|nr:hypothetical protein HRbin18_00360 [bacterium HR18]